MVLGRSGLLAGGLVIPQFVLDHVHSVAEAPDPVSSRRARRGLESIEALREMDVPVHVARDEVPEVDDLVIKLLTVARRVGLRIGTCSSKVVDEAARWDVLVVDFRDVAHGLSPDHLPGERLAVELIREGRQPRQAIGYLPSGDMVVVNDATHLVDQGTVEVTVLSTRPTSQGVMVFAKVATDTDSAAVTEAEELSDLALSPRLCVRVYASLTAATSLVRVSLASPNSKVVLSSKSRSLSIPAKPGRIDRLRNTMFSASSALMMGMP